MDPSDVPTRISQIKHLSQHQLLGAACYILGDFNFVHKDKDRVLLPSATNPTLRWGSADREESEAWYQGLPSFVELWQPDYTFNRSTRSTRLDRCYTNLTHADRLAFRITSLALHLPHKDEGPPVSDHRPLSVRIRLPSKAPINKIPRWITEHYDFARKALEIYYLSEFQDSANPYLRLQALNDAIKAAAGHVRTLPPELATTIPARLGSALTLYRLTPPTPADIPAALSSARFQKGLLVDPGLQPIFSQLARDASGGLQAFSSYITTLQLEAYESRVASLAPASAESDTEGAFTGGARASRARHGNNFAREVKRAYPEASPALHTLEDPETHSYTQDPATIARIANKHWQSVFSRRPFNRNAFNVDSATYQRRLPEGSWAISLLHVDQVLNSLPSSSPGPNGIPFHAYRRLYILALPIFHALLTDLVSPTGHTPPADFNQALLYLLPKKPSSVSAALGPAYTPKNARPSASLTPTTVSWQPCSTWFFPASPPASASHPRGAS